MLLRVIRKIFNALKSLLNFLINKFKNIPISLRVTLYYSLFILALFGVLISVCAFILDEVSLSSVSQKRLAKSVRKMANESKFKSFDDGVFFILYSAKGKILDGFVPRNFSAKLGFSDKLREYENDDEEFYYFDAKIKDGGWVRGVIAISEFERELTRILIALLALAPFIIIIIIYGGYKIIKNAFLPVKIMSQTAEEIGASGDFTRRLNLPKGKDELSSLAITLNSMLSSLEANYKRERALSANISHELRTPTAIILAQSDYALNYELDKDEIKESFLVINRQSHKITLIIEQILELFKLEGAINLNLTKLNLSEILTNTLNDFKHLADKKGLNLSYLIAPNVLILGDELLLARLIDNLLDNALKFGKTSIFVRLLESGELSVKDDGVGIADDELELIWDKFYQSERSRNKAKNAGVGLGLALIARITKLLDAKIGVKSELNKSSEFSVNFKVL